MAPHTISPCSRRRFLTLGGFGLGTAALATLLGARHRPAPAEALPRTVAPTFAGAKRIIYLFQCGGPSQLDLFDYKPLLEHYHGAELPASIRQGQRITGMTSVQDTLPLTASRYRFARHGRSGAWVSNVFPHTARVVDDLCFIKSMHTEAINHDPAATLLFTGDQRPGKPSLGAWLSYGLGGINQNLPAFVVIVAQSNGQPAIERYWGNGFLPGEHQGVRFRSGPDPVFYLNNPPGIDRATRRRTLDDLAQLNRLQHDVTGDPGIDARIAQYELAFRMQTAVPQLTDLSGEPASTYNLYGDAAREPGSYAASCILARRLAEQGVRFIQVIYRGWDHHTRIGNALPRDAATVDQASAALVLDLKRRGLLEDTLIVWGGEFGRTVYGQGDIGSGAYGRDHHPRCFTIWLAGGGVRAGHTHGATDDFGYNVAQGPVHIHDLNATILHLMGLDHTRLTYRVQGRDFRLTDTAGHVVREILA